MSAKKESGAPSFPRGRPASARNTPRPSPVKIFIYRYTARNFDPKNRSPQSEKHGAEAVFLSLLPIDRKFFL